MLILLIGTGLQYLKTTQDTELKKRTLSVSKLLLTTGKDAVISSDIATLENYVSDFLNNPGVVYIRFINTENVILAQGGVPDSLNRKFSADTDLHTVDDGVYDIKVDISLGEYKFGEVQAGFTVEEFRSQIKQAETNLEMFTT